MKKLLPALLLCLLAFASCKKEQPPATPATPTPPVITTPPTTPMLASISSVSPTSGSDGTLVIITGINFGTSTAGVEVLFNGKAGAVQSVTPNEIKVVMPVTTTGVITLTVLGQTIPGPQFTYLSPLPPTPYVSGDVTFSTQTAVDEFTLANKGRQLQITGNLDISGPAIISVAGLSNITSVSGKVSIWCRTLTEASFLNTLTTAGDIEILYSGFSSLSFNSLNSFSGKINFQGLQNLSRVSFNELTTSKGIGITLCPLLTDLSFLNKLKSCDGFSFSNSGATAIIMDQLTTTGGMYVAACQNLNTISMKALTEVTAAAGNFNFSYCPLLSNLNFSSLTTISDKLTIINTNITDFTGFNSLVKLGSLTVTNNPVLANFHGLEQLTTFTKPAIGIGASSNLMTRLNGIYAVDNPQLTSLTGLQDITTLPVAYITGNANLNDFCMLKSQIISLSTLPAYAYRYANLSNRYFDTSIAALTLSDNGKYANTADALVAVALCK